MSDDAPLPPPEEPSAGDSKSPEENASRPPDILKVKRRFRMSDSEKDSAENSDPEELVLHSLLRKILRKGDAGSNETEPPAKIHRFVPKSTAAVEPPSALLTLPAAGAEASPAPRAGNPLINFSPRTSKSAGGRGRNRFVVPWKTLGYLALLLLVSSVAYFAGRSSERSAALATASGSAAAAPVPQPVTVWTQATVSQLDAVLAADQSGDLKAARQLAAALKKRIPNAPGLDLYLSTFDVRQSRFNDADVAVSRTLNALTAPLEVASANEHFGFIYARHREFARAVTAFENAAMMDPFNAIHFQHWGETLRRNGRLQEAIERFQQALVRLGGGQPGLDSQRNEIEFKIHLAQIELGKDEDVKTAIDTHLREPAPGGYWFLTAAAFALQHGEMAAAADALGKARVVLSPDDYAVLASDYFFHAFAGRQELVGLLPGDSLAESAQTLQARTGFFIDP